MLNELTQNELMIAGLGSLGAANKFAASEVGATPTRLAALNRIPALPKAVQEALKNGDAQLAELNVYDTVPFKGHIADFFESSIKEEVGITNLDGGKFNQGEYAIITGIQIFYDADAGNTGLPKGLNFNTSVFPAALLNGNFKMIIDKNEAIPEQSVRVFHNGVAGYDTDKAFGLYILDNPKIIEPLKSFKLGIEAADDVPGFLKVMLRGVRVIAK